MSRQRRMMVLIYFVLLMQIQDIVHSYSLSKQNTFFKCPSVQSDESVISKEGFQVPAGQRGHSKSYALMTHPWIHKLRVVQKAFIPKDVFGLKRLEYLEVEKSCFEPCSQSEIPIEIQCLAASLLEFSVENTRIIHIPKEMGQLKKLRSLILIRTDLVSLPEIIGDLSSLEKLDLSFNDLQELPTTIRKLSSLKFLTLNNNPYLRSIQPINGLSSLLILDARNCRIEKIPRDLPRLYSLKMRNNTLKDLVDIETIGRQSNDSKRFDFTGNQIGLVLPGLLQIKNLSKVQLTNNQITQLPSEIENVQTRLDLYIEKNCFNQQFLQQYNNKLLVKNSLLRLTYKDQRTCSN